MYRKKCIECNKLFTTKYNFQIFCSTKCRVYNWRKKMDYNKYHREYYKKNREKIKERQRNRSRNKNLSAVINNEIVTFRNIKKRHYPIDKCCEVCKKEKKLDYHHWGKINQKEIIKGIWVCHPCHMIIEHFEKEKFQKIYKKYLKIREIIEVELDNERKL